MATVMPHKRPESVVQKTDSGRDEPALPMEEKAQVLLSDEEREGKRADPYERWQGYWRWALSLLGGRASQLHFLEAKERYDSLLALTDYHCDLIAQNQPADHEKAIAIAKCKETLDRALQASGYYKAKPKNVGRGMALAQWMTNGGKGTVKLGIDEKGQVSLSSAVVDQGGGTFTVLCEIVGQELGIPAETISVQSLDTGRGIEDTGIGGSRVTRVFGNAAYEAVIKAKDISMVTAEVTMVPSSTVKVVGNDAKQLLNLMESIEDHEDVQNVYANFDIPDEEIEKIS